ncbi:MAG: Leucine-rich repeat (LRR) protein [Candidatus Paceibacteria bacterium]|jgi:Leucine-rich repeat (LRR) protein
MHIGVFSAEGIEFSLHRLKLKVLPDCIGDLTWLTTLHLNDNQLTKLPERFGELKSLTTLNLTHNQLTELPEWCRELTSLTELLLAGNQLTKLPDWFGDLTSLTAMRLSGNQLTKLPERFSELTRLRYLHLNNNQLTKLPERFSELTSLEHLEVHNNQLTEPPEWIGKMPSLYILEVHSNPFTFLSDEIRNMRVFKRWGLNNALWALPTTCPPSAPTTDASAESVVTTTTSTTLPAHPNPPNPLPLTPEQPLDAEPPLQQVTFTAEDRASQTTLQSMQAAIDAIVANQTTATLGATLPRKEMDKLIAFMQIQLEEGREKQQLKAELGALSTEYPDTAKSGLLLYTLLSKTLIGLHDNAPLITSGVGNNCSRMASSKAAPAGVAISVLNIVPMVGNQLASATRAAFNSIDQNHVRQNLLLGLEAMTKIDNAGTPLAQQATMQRLTHALVYRLALHHCAKETLTPDKITTAVKTSLGIDNRSISNYQTYAKKITDAILTSQRTFRDASVEAVVSHLLAAALTSATRSQDRAKMKAQLLGEKHQQIIDELTPTAEPVAPPPQPIAAPMATVRSLHSPSTWVRPTVAKLPDVIREMAIPEPPLDEPVTPKTRRLLHKMYRSSDEEEVRDAGERLETRMHLKQVMQQNAQLHMTNDQLRTTIDQLQGDARNPDREQQMLQDTQRLQKEVGLLRRKMSTLEPDTDVGTSSDGGLIAAQMPRVYPGQGQLAQNIQNAEFDARINDQAQRIDVLQGIAGIAQMQPPAPGPAEASNRRRLFGNWRSEESRR